MNVNKMNRLKSIFISLATATWAYFSYLAIILAIGEGINMATVGVFMVSIVPTEFFARLLLLKPWARTSKGLPFYTGSVIIGVGIVLYMVYTGVLANQFAMMSLVSLLFWLLYILWYSKLPSRDHKNLKPGKQLPELKFMDQTGETVRTSQFVGKKVVYLFYRGNWCPLCMAQIKELAGEYQSLSQREVEVVLISPQPHKYSKDLAQKMAVDFHFLTDENNRVARQLGLDHKSGVPFGMEVLGYDSETVLPTVIITDEQGKILFLDQTDNYRLRPEPSTFLQVIDAA